MSTLHPLTNPALDLPWHEWPDTLVDDGTWCITDCFGKRVATGLLQIDAEAIVETMNMAWMAEMDPPRAPLKLALKPEDGEQVKDFLAFDAERATQPQPQRRA